jgi:hypothetical protein
MTERFMKIISLSFCVLIAALSPALAGDTSETVSLRSPSGNIHCLLFADPADAQDDPIASCELETLDGGNSMPPKPVDCQADYGFRYYVTANGKAGPVCATGSLKDPEARALGYGESTTFHGLTCISEKTGFSCTNDAGHGFKLSKATQQVF